MTVFQTRYLRFIFICTIMLLQLASSGTFAADLTSLPVLSAESAAPLNNDWLVTPPARSPGLYRDSTGAHLILDNGLIRRSFTVTPNAATFALDNLLTGQSMLRAVKPEAILTLNGVAYPVGGLSGQPNKAFLKTEWLAAMKPLPKAFQYTHFSTGPIRARMEWKRVRHHAPGAVWPPAGLRLTLHFKATAPEISGMEIDIHHDLYQGSPLMGKSFTFRNQSDKPVMLDAFTLEQLAVVEHESAVDTREQWAAPNLHIESDYAFKGMDPSTANRVANWVPDPSYGTQVNYERKTPCMLEVRPPIGPGRTIAAGESFESFNCFILAPDSTERERKALAVRRMFRTVAPWATENPILMHVRSADPKAVRLAIDQCAEVGFEMVIMTFGSGFNIENSDPKYVAQIKALVDYAHSKKVDLGGYSLLASRSVGPQHDVINAKTGKPGGAIFGNSPCIGSTWGAVYFRKLYAFHKATGLDILEHDGSYPGDVCASTTHPGHKGLADSQWTQWRTITDYYKWCRGNGVYLNVPDFYFLAGSSKVGMGYRETNWSLPRAQQILHARQNIYDGTWEKTPSMGWMFVPLTEYHGGGPAATIEPLADHLDTYDAHFANLFGAGVQACFRGPRLFDGDKTRDMVRKWVDFYKAHRDILESDIIHLRRADGRRIDGLLHVNSGLKEKGMAFFYNPSEKEQEETFKLPLYYTGLTETAKIQDRSGMVQTLKLDREYNVMLKVKLPAGGYGWFIVE